MVDQLPCIDIGENFQSYLVAPFLLIDPRSQRLLHDPSRERSARRAIASTLSASSAGTWAVKILVSAMIFSRSI
jgi:hypothetical protein